MAVFNRLLREDKTVKGDDGKATVAPLSKKTVQNVKICLRKAFNDARGRYLPFNRENPVVGVALKYSRAKNRAEMKTWSLEEQQTFLDSRSRRSPTAGTALDQSRLRPSSPQSLRSAQALRRNDRTASCAADLLLYY
jgi:hypothetical protein